MFNIGVLHTALEGNAMHANYAPCSLDELHAKGYQNWALGRSEEHTSELQSLMRISYAVFCLKKKKSTKRKMKQTTTVEQQNTNHHTLATQIHSTYRP